jgi:hypothetical protein
MGYLFLTFKKLLATLFRQHAIGTGGGFEIGFPR